MDALTKCMDRANSIATTVYSQALRLKQAGMMDKITPTGPVFDMRGQIQTQRNLNSFRSWVYSAVNAHAGEAASQPVFVGRKKKPDKKTRRGLQRKSFLMSKMTSSIRQKVADEELEVLPHHSLVDILDHPNPVQYRWQFVYTFIANLNLTGRAYIVLDKDEDGNLVLWSLPSTWVRPDHKEGAFSKFYVGDPRRPETFADAEPFDASQVAMAYLPDPADPLGSISPASSQQSAIRIDDKIQMVSEKHFENGVFPSMVVTVGKDPHPDVPGGMRPRLTVAQRRQVVGAIKRAMGGVENYGGLAIVDGLIESITKLGATQNEIGWDKSEDKVKARILSAYCVHPFILGEMLSVGSHAQTYQIEKRFFARLNIFLDMISVLMTDLVRANQEEGEDEDLVIWWEQKVAIDKTLEDANWRFARQNGDISQNEFRQQRLGLSADEDDREAVLSPALIGAIAPLLAAGLPVDQLRAFLEGAGIDEELAKRIAGTGEVPPPTPQPPQEPLVEATGALQAAIGVLRHASVESAVLDAELSQKYSLISLENV